MWKLIAIAVLLMVLLLAIIVMSGCPRLKTGEEIEAEKREELGTGPIPPPPPPPSEGPDAGPPPAEKPVGDKPADG